MVEFCVTRNNRWGHAYIPVKHSWNALDRISHHQILPPKRSRTVRTRWRRNLSWKSYYFHCCFESVFNLDPQGCNQRSSQPCSNLIWIQRLRNPCIQTLFSPCPLNRCIQSRIPFKCYGKQQVHLACDQSCIAWCTLENHLWSNHRIHAHKKSAFPYTWLFRNLDSRCSWIFHISALMLLLFLAQRPHCCRLRLSLNNRFVNVEASYRTAYIWSNPLHS